jgi:hypothetical protein
MPCNNLPPTPVLNSVPEQLREKLIQDNKDKANKLLLNMLKQSQVAYVTRGKIHYE